MKIVEFQETPNPNATKCVLEGSIPAAGASGLRSYTSQEQASRDPLARALLGIPGVKSVLIEQGWATLLKSPDAKWERIRAEARRIVEATDGAG